MALTTGLWQTSPLVVPELVYNKQIFTVKLRLDEPLISKKDLRQLISLCAIADAAIERVHRLQHGADGSDEAFDMQLLCQIDALCQQVAPNASTKEVLQELGLFAMFPYLKQMHNDEEVKAAAQNAGDAYFSYISLLNQVVMMGTQLYHDACIPQHHKYCAHQIALLYQCLNMLQGETKPIRRLVEARFDEIKQITESKNPILDMEVSDWLQEITWLCREEIKNCPSYIHKKLQPMTSILNS